jgi:transcription-repair coupling factor (superfamily II helicase)
VARLSLTQACVAVTRALDEPPAGRADAHGRIRVAGLRGGSSAYAAAQCASRLARPLVVVTRDAEAAEAFAADLRFFLDDAPDNPPTARRVHYFPAWEVPPFEALSPTREVAAARMQGLFHLVQTPGAVLVTSVEAAAQRLIPRARAGTAWLYLVRGEVHAPEEVSAYLARWGYHRVPLVQDLGEYAIRGGILDVFPAGYTGPLRIEFAGDAIEDIRAFDPASQRSGDRREEILLLPVQEYEIQRLSEPAVLKAVDLRATEMGLPRRERHRWVDAMRAGLPLPGVEFLLPYLFDALDPLAAYLPPTAVLWLVDPGGIESAVDALWREIEVRAAQVPATGIPAPPPERLFVTPAEMRAMLGARPAVEVEALEDLAADRQLRVTSFGNQGLAITPSARGAEPSLAPLAARLRDWLERRLRIVVVVSTRTQAERLRQLLGHHGLDFALVEGGLGAAQRCAAGAGLVTCGELSAGFQLPDDALAMLTEEEIFGERRTTRRARRYGVADFLSSLAELKPDDYVVHLDHGVGIYRGLRHLKVAGTEGDYLHVEYAGGDRLYLPVDRINLVQRYVGTDGAAPALDKLGGASWERVKTRARESILAMAHELLEIHAAREVMEVAPSSVPDDYFREFEARFPFDETPDQRTAIEDVLADMQRAKPMDRLVCGDVGYGKTEVALRAAFLAVMDGEQVAVLVPTTILAQQHVETFRRRFAGYPVRIEMLSRFRSARENRDVIEALAGGQIDIVIGTHRLLQDDVHFRKLGLLVVDEEHRFGVADKERIKRLRRQVDVLTLTATPIPRTLQMSLSGMRDLSVIETPPVDRLAIRTYIARFDDHVVRDAVLRELRRGGQVFFVHNRVETIDATARWLQQLVPEAQCAVAHGQMSERELERVMHAFLSRETNVLVCSAIIESGLDIPSANTIVINRADTFGLAQLYQLRGRVGRSHQRAYAYLLIPGEQLISRDAQKRLRVLQELDDLGGGFRLAAHDLEIRGAGNLLGKQQSGHIAAVGLELYMRMMEDAVLELRGEQRRAEVEPEIQLGIPAFIPEDYVPDVSQRLVLYKRLAAAAGPRQLDELAAELRDRFGPLPPLVDTLLQVMDLRCCLKVMLVERLRRRGEHVVFDFHPETPATPERLSALVAESGGRCRMTGEYQLSFLPAAHDWDGMLRHLRDFLRPLATAP